MSQNLAYFPIRCVLKRIFISSQIITLCSVSMSYSFGSKISSVKKNSLFAERVIRKILEVLQYSSKQSLMLTSAHIGIFGCEHILSYYSLILFEK